MAVARPEPNAFLNKTAPNMSAVINQIRTDPEVYARYRKHFGMSKEELIRYFESLKPSRIEDPGPYLVYNIRDDGVIRSRVFNLKKGSFVFVDSMGTPVLKMVCGNPMIGGPSDLTAINLMHDAPLAAMAELRPVEEFAPTAESPAAIMVAEELDSPPVETAPPVAPPVTPIVPPTPPVVKPSYEVGSLSLLPLLSGGLIGLLGGGGGNGGVIPEPATMGAMATIFALYGAHRARRRKTL